ncbi:MAG: hypothetical protein WD512_00035 [Candidatus Paceibacterota bacterium]
MKPEEIENMLKDHEKQIKSLEQRITKLEGKEKLKPLESNEYDQDTKAIFDLIGDSFFDKLKKRKEIIKQLKTNATFSPKANYKKCLEVLVKDRHLLRKDVGHQWAYVKMDDV